MTSQRSRFAAEWAGIDPSRNRAVNSSDSSSFVCVPISHCCLALPVPELSSFDWCLSSEVCSKPVKRLVRSRAVSCSWLEQSRSRIKDCSTNQAPCESSLSERSTVSSAEPLGLFVLWRLTLNSWLLSCDRVSLFLCLSVHFSQLSPVIHLQWALMSSSARF